MAAQVLRAGSARLCRSCAAILSLAWQSANLGYRSVGNKRAAFPRILLPVVIVALPAVLLLSSVRTFRELEEQKSVYLRVRAAAVAGALENLSDAGDDSAAFEALSETEGSLLDLELLRRDSPAGRREFLTPLWEGQELFRTEHLTQDGQRIYRAWVPFHSIDGLRIARIDLDAAAADFLVVHARHNVIVSLAGGLAVIVLAAYAIWSARRATRLEVRQLELEHMARIGQMSAVLAHEIRNPLGTIKGFAQLIGESRGHPHRELVDPILAETTRLENLVKNLLLYGRPPRPQVRMTDWAETAQAISRHAAHLLGKTGARFELTGPNLAWETDPEILEQALLNLLRNAAEAIEGQPGGEIRLEALADGNSGVTVALSDNGPGIPEEIRARLFEPFRTTKAFGTGLGLSITRNLARSLGGDLLIEPAARGGTRAVLRFPHAKAQVSEARKG